MDGGCRWNTYGLPACHFLGLCESMSHRPYTKVIGGCQTAMVPPQGTFPVYYSTSPYPPRSWSLGRAEARCRL
jgi:hypothetical protein